MRCLDGLQLFSIANSAPGRRLALAAVCMAVGIPFTAAAQQLPQRPTAARPAPSQPQPFAPASQAVPGSPSTVRDELDAVMKRLVDQTKAVDRLAQQLRDTSKIKPEDMKKEVEGAANTLAGLLDKLRDGGDIDQQINSLRNAAATHRQRVEGGAPVHDHDVDAALGEIDPGDQSDRARPDNQHLALFHLRQRIRPPCPALWSGERRE